MAERCRASNSSRYFSTALLIRIYNRSTAGCEPQTLSSCPVLLANAFVEVSTLRSVDACPTSRWAYQACSRYWWYDGDDVTKMRAPGGRQMSLLYLTSLTRTAQYDRKWILTIYQLSSHIAHHCTKFQRNRATYGWVIDELAIFHPFFKGVDFQDILVRGRWIKQQQIWGEHTLIIVAYNGLLWYWRFLVPKWSRLKDEWCQNSRPNFACWPPPPMKISGGVGENAEW